jgi:hypothetical protein
LIQVGGAGGFACVADPRRLVQGDRGRLRCGRRDPDLLDAFDLNGPTQKEHHHGPANAGQSRLCGAVSGCAGDRIRQCRQVRHREAVIEAFYGKPAQRSYFFGSSDGGREALMEAQRYPEDFDAIIAGAPANNWSNLFTGFVWNEQALLNDSLPAMQTME